MAKEPFITGIMLMEIYMGVRDDYTEEDFKKAGLPMTVACFKCGNEMPLKRASLFAQKGKDYLAVCAAGCK